MIIMNKQEFLKALSDRLQGIPKEDREKSLEYYSEMIDDRTEDGLTEEQAVKAMGNVNEIADKIINDTPIEKLIRKKVTPERKLSALEIVLLTIGFPIWFPIGISLIAVAFALYLVLWVLILCIYIIAFAFAVSGIASIIALFMSIWSGQILWGLFLLGCGMVLLGLAIPILIEALRVTFGCISLTGKLFKKLKSSLAKRKGGAV
jgi:uncharacterized membrane protein